METSFYQSLKPVVVNIFGLTHDAIHMYVGFFAFVSTLVYWKTNKSMTKSLLPGFILSVIMECMDVHDDPRPIQNTDLILACFHDLINTNFIPFFIVIFIKKFKRKLVD